MGQIRQSKSGSLRFRLREVTAASHLRVENSMAVIENCRSPDAYRALLCRMWGLYVPLEETLATFDWDTVAIEFSQRLKVPLLQEDLRSLGLPLEGIETLPRATLLPSMDSLEDAIGVLYVLEGATLGGQIILRQIKGNLGITEECGGRFFASYGSEVGSRWRSFIAALECFGVRVTAVDRIERAALSTYESFVAWSDEMRIPAGGSANAN